SPQLFRQFLAPGYKKLVGFFQDWGIKIVLVDSDGDVSRLIPEWLEVGITGIYPLEVAAGMDVTEIRENFPHLQMIGGLDKRALVSGKAAIDQELEKVANLVSKGGYIPCIDHLVPPDVSWGNFRYYRERLNAILRNL
ncbi:MAG: uroporphyrinogen decarboxylase family protein, partial [Candidatus Methanomethyliaceae archaeon]